MCSEQFAIGKSTVSGIVRDVVHAVNEEFRSEIQFLRSKHLQHIMREFEQFCGLPTIASAIDGTHIYIRKSYVGLEDYFYFKTSSYNMQMQAIVDKNK